MKEMVYGNRKNPEVLYSGEYKGHKFAILSLGSHPTAYVENKMAITDYHDCRLDNVEVHGGFTYCDKGYWDEESKKTSWFGWDYAHYPDYYYSDPPWGGKQWSTEEIYDEVKSVIEQIITVEKYNDSSEYKAIRDMILDAKNDDRDIQRACKKLYAAGYRKASEVIGEFVEKINLVECEMFHKAHDIRNASEEKLDRCNWKDDLQWGEYKKQEGKMIALQDFMTKIKRIAAEYGVEVKE